MSRSSRRRAPTLLATLALVTPAPPTAAQPATPPASPEDARPVTVQDWVAAANAALTSDPARAIANYEKADTLFASLVNDPNAFAFGTSRWSLAEARKRAATAWLTREAAARATAAPTDALAFVVEARRRAEALGINTPDAVYALEASAFRALVEASSARAPGVTPFEALGRLRALRPLVPRYPPELGAELTAEIERTERALLAETEARAATPGAEELRLSRAAVRAALRGAPTLAPAHAALVEAVRPSLRVTRVEGTCPAQVRDAVRSVALPPGQGPAVELEVTGLRCDASEARATRTATYAYPDEVVTGSREVVTGRTATSTECSAYAIRNASGQWERSCQTSGGDAITRREYDTVETLGRVSWEVRTRTLTAQIDGVARLRGPGARALGIAERPIAERVTTVEEAYAIPPRPDAVPPGGWSEDVQRRHGIGPPPAWGSTRAFTAAGAEDQLRAARDRVVRALSDLAQELGRREGARLATTAVAHLRAGRAEEAERTAVLAVWLGAALPDELAPLAVAAGMPLAAWTAAIAGRAVAPPTVPPSSGVHGLGYPSPDPELLARQRRARGG